MMRAKMRLEGVFHDRYGPIKAFFACDYDSTPEDNTFAKSTPSGSMELVIDNPKVHKELVIGESYYVDIYPCHSGPEKEFK